MKVTPYDTGKVKIGVHYVPPPPKYAMSADMERLQASLLEVKLERNVELMYALLWVAVAGAMSLVWVCR